MISEYLSKNKEFTVTDNGVKLQRGWENTKMDIESIESIIKTYPSPSVPFIFNSVYHEGQKTKEKRDFKKAIQRGFSKYLKDLKENKVRYIFATNDMLDLGTKENPINNKEYTDYLIGETRGSLIVMDYVMYHTEWIQNLLKNNKVDFVVYDKYPKEDVETYNFQEILNMADRKECYIYVIGGINTFRTFYPLISRMLITFLKDWKEESTEYFSEIDFNSFETISCTPYPNGEDILVDLRKISNRTPKWKKNPFH